MSKIATIIDFNNIAMRAMFTCPYMGDNTIKNFDTDEECDILIRKIVFDLSMVLRTFSPERVIIACDAKDPWRNTLYGDIDGEGYKGTREKDDTKNWGNIFKSFDELKDILRLKGMVVSEIENTEADDLAAMWRDCLFSEGYNVIMVSSDKDWSQLIRFIPSENSGNLFCVSYNPIAVKQSRKIYVTKDFIEWYNKKDTVDIFFSNYDEIKDKMHKIMEANSKIVFDIMDPDRVLIDKVMCGDDGDNIPAFYEYYKNGKKTRVTPLKASHVYEALSINNVCDLEKASASGSLKQALEKEMKKEIEIDFDSRLYRQRRLVELNPVLFPEAITKTFEKHKEDMSDKGYVSTMNIKMEDVLKDSRFLNKDYNKPRENSIFDDITLLNKFSKSPKLF